MFEPRMSVVQLSRGATWNPSPGDRPYLIATVDEPWPEGSTATCVFSDTSGGVLLTVTGTVTPEAISFKAPPSDVDPIKGGCNFEIFLTLTNGDVYKIRYGKVVRMEAPLTTAPATVVASQALKFTDSFPTLGLRSNWVAVSGRARVHDNSASSLPHSVGPDFDALFSQSAIRWDTPLNGESCRVHVTVIDPSPIVIQAKTTIILCADQRLTSFLGVQFESSSGTNHLHIGTGDSPTSLTDRVPPITHDVVNGDDYTIAYDDLTKKVFIYQGTDTTPLLSWTDSMAIVPHGPGYRYLGMAFMASLTPFGPGVQVTGWQALDGV